jgi:hypothetical protein
MAGLRRGRHRRGAQGQRPARCVYIEAYGEVQVTADQIASAHDGKVILKVETLRTRRDPPRPDQPLSRRATTKRDGGG